MDQARERAQELAEAEGKYISANIKSRAEALAAVEAMMREYGLTQSQYEAIRDALIAQNVISATAGQAYAGAWQDLLYGDLAEYGVGYAPVLGNIYFAKKRKEAAASQAGAASGGVAVGGALPPDKGPEDKEKSTLEITFPEKEAQIKHIFRDKEGHFLDTPENRRKILDVANNPRNYLGQDARGNDWYSIIDSDGNQIWVRVRNGKIDNAGINTTPRLWDPDTGLYNNTKK